MHAHALKRFRLHFREGLAAALCLSLFLVAAAVYFSSSRPKLYRLSISGGSPDGLRHQIAERLAAVARGHELILRVAGTTGSREALDQLEAHSLDVALVQGGLDHALHPHVRQVAALHIEPLHLLVKPHLRAEVSPNLAALKGKTINLGPVGSGTHELARDVLRFAGLEPRDDTGLGDYTVASLGYGELLAADLATLPDAIFTVSPLPSPVVRTLVGRQHYHLVELPFGEAFALDALSRRSSAAPNPDSVQTSSAAKLRVHLTSIPPFTYGIEPPSPPLALRTFGPRLLVVAHEAVPSTAVRRILEAVFSREFAELTNPPLESSALASSPEYPLHRGTEEYVEYNKPLVAGDLIDLADKGISLLGGLLGGAFFLWHWVRQHYRRKRELRFESYMVKVAAIEERALALEMEASLDLKELLALQRELARLKNEALARFADGEVEGEQLMSGFVSHVNDARNYVNRLILHERDNIEERASKERRSTRALWDEAISPGGAERPRTASQNEEGERVERPLQTTPT
jgi:TRAP-type uncharacterized transport system substrate-binding protein